ncbi:helix-turn-helix domain-containing protein [Branchiibius cervicis]|uniref:Helix-turn-helix domain-containing protein n=1 Tax=Branchiibius cervicis TaxID=908252 RepID=A0ABW2AQ48_9MICO
MADLIRMPPHPAEPLWRELLGDVLRRRRHDRGETLHETSRRAGVSPQYLSEIERGRKDPSSEMVAALAGALGTTLVDLTAEVTRAGRPAPPSLNALLLAA